MQASFSFTPWHCPICGPSPETTLGQRKGPSPKEDCTIVACQICGLLYANPFPVPQSLEALYSDATLFFDEENTKEKVLACQKFLEKLPLAKNEIQALDIGAGCGEFVYAAQKYGVSVTGIEFSPALRKKAQERFGVILSAEKLEEHKSEKPYTLITFNAVLEHLHEPMAALKQAEKLLAKGGYLYIEVPKEPYLHARLARYAQRLRGKKTVYYLSPTKAPFHVYGFNEKSLSTALTALGLKIVGKEIHSTAHFLPNPKKSVWIKTLNQALNFFANCLNDAPNIKVLAKK